MISLKETCFLCNQLSKFSFNWNVYQNYYYLQFGKYTNLYRIFPRKNLPHQTSLMSAIQDDYVISIVDIILHGSLVVYILKWLRLEFKNIIRNLYQKYIKNFENVEFTAGHENKTNQELVLCKKKMQMVRDTFKQFLALKLFTFCQNHASGKFQGFFDYHL